MAFKWVTLPILQRTCNSTIRAVLIKNMSGSAGSTAANIGFIGLGNMGGHMARNLLKKVRQILGFVVEETC